MLLGTPEVPRPGPEGNPNVLECLYTPIVESATPLARELLDMRAAFLSRLVYQTYNGYVMSQFKKLEQDLRAKGAIKWKHAMHLIRLLLSGITVLREGFVPVRVEEYRAALLAIKAGETPWDEINAWRLRLHQEFDAALAVTKLPDRPEYERGERVSDQGEEGAGPMTAATHSTLLGRWERLCRGAGLRGDVEGAAREIFTRYSEPHRRYHNVDHLADCLEMLDRHAGEAQDLVAVELALWFHDAVYDIGAPDNEHRSAELARRTLEPLGLPPARLEAVSAAIMATTHKGEPGPGDARLVCDIDLSILGSPEPKYRGYAQAILAESGMTMAVFRPLRLRFLETMLARGHLFHTVAFRESMGSSARDNMAREMERLSNGQ